MLALTCLGCFRVLAQTGYTAAVRHGPGGYREFLLLSFSEARLWTRASFLFEQAGH